MRFFSRLIVAVFSASLILPAALAAPAFAATATQVAFATQPGGANGGALLSPQPVVELRDGTNAVDTTATNTVTLTLTGAPAGVTLSCAPVAAVAGVATFTGCSVNKAGTYTLDATAGLLPTTASAAFTITVGPADHLTWFVEPVSPSPAGVAFSSQPVIQVRDLGNNVVTAGPTYDVTVNIDTPNSPPGGTMTGVAPVTTIAGVATFTGLSVDKAQNGYRFVATSSPVLPDDRSDLIDIVAGAVDHLSFGQGPTSTGQGAAISPAVTVQVRDNVQNVVLTDTRSVVMTLQNGTVGATLGGTTSVAAVAGVATFSNLSVNLTGTGYTLHATASAVTATSSGSFNISLAPNHAPSGADKTIAINEDATRTLVAADFGFADAADVPSNFLLAVKIPTLPAAGSLTDNGVAVTAGATIPVADITANKLVFTPAANANGAPYASFTFQVQDDGGTAGGGVDTDQTANTITFNVTAINDAPVAVADTNVVKQGTTLTTTALTGVLANDTDVEGTALTAVLDTTTTHGVLVLNSNGSYTYTPTGSYTGADAFTYHAFDGTAPSNVVTVALTVYVNHTPVAVADSKNIITGSPATAVDVLANDNAANPDTGETLTIAAVGAAAHGTVSITAGGTSVKYKPKSTFLGTDHFTYRVTDGVLSATATVTIHVIKDKVKPTTTNPVQTITTQKIGASTVVVHLAWTGADVGSGVAKYQLQQSKNNGSYKTVSLSSKLAKSSNRTLTVNSTYRFRVRAVDKRGNVGAWSYGPKFKVLRFQETSATFAGTWSARTSVNYSGGHERSTSQTGASATFTTTGRTFSWVAVRGTTRGTAQVFVDGVLAKSLNLSLSSTKYRYVVFSTTLSSASHSIRIVFTGAAPKLIDLDGFIVLR